MRSRSASGRGSTNRLCARRNPAAERLASPVPLHPNLDDRMILNHPVDALGAYEMEPCPGTRRASRTCVLSRPVASYAQGRPGAMDGDEAVRRLSQVTESFVRERRPSQIPKAGSVIRSACEFSGHSRSDHWWSEALGRSAGDVPRPREMPSRDADAYVALTTGWPSSNRTAPRSYGSHEGGTFFERVHGRAISASVRHTAETYFGLRNSADPLPETTC